MLLYQIPEAVHDIDGVSDQITCVSGSLARSSRKRIIALKTSSLEVFAGSHLDYDDHQMINVFIAIIILEMLS